MSVSREAEEEARLALDELRSLTRPARQKTLNTASGSEEARARGAEGAEAVDDGHEAAASRSTWRPVRRSRGAARPMPPVPTAVAGGGPLAAAREALPVFQHRAPILAALRSEVSIVEGETGSGKTTQVAQYLLEEAAASGRRINILCTQPRRISAIGVAERVAAERGERAGEGAVGYAVRGESKQGSATSVLFCTTGVLLRMIEEDPTLANVTHVLVDEVSAG